MKWNGARWPRSTIVLLAVVLVALLVAAVLLYGSAGAETRADMRLELFKGVLQLAGVVIVGGGIALLYKWIEHSWESAREQAELRRRYIARLGDAYRAVRQARRILRACGIKGAGGGPGATLTELQLDCYDEQMLAISREQLALEALGIESQHFPATPDAKALTAELGVMARYLGRLVTEYERYRPDGPVALRDLVRLREFTRGAGEDAGPIDPRAGTLQENFVKPHFRAIALVMG
jgi:hypothetical protein